MCDCMNEKVNQLKETFGYEYVSPPLEIISGRAYIKFTIREKGKKKGTEMPMLLSKCPFCGEEYKK